ncbi:hypothetical protein ASPZODRAFT_125862, partial [Penicilliopsis zonata CBS 506.65]
MGPKRPLQGAAKRSHEQKKARLANGPILAEMEKIQRRAGQGLATIQQAREKLQEYEPASDQDKTRMILEELLAALPSNGQQNLVQDICGKSSDELVELAAEVVTFLFTKHMLSGGRTPTPSPSPSISYEGQARTGNGQETLKQRCLRRDSNRCIISGYYDASQFKTLAENEQTGIKTGWTKCAHIIPYFSAPALTHHNAQASPRTWAYLYRYFPSVHEVIDAMTPGSINIPENAMTLLAALHEEFGSFHFGLIPTAQERQYEIQTFRDMSDWAKLALPKDYKVVFGTETDCDLPSPKLLAIHLAICKVLNATGLAQEID